MIGAMTLLLFAESDGRTINVLKWGAAGGDGGEEARGVLAAEPRSEAGDTGRAESMLLPGRSIEGLPVVGMDSRPSLAVLPDGGRTVTLLGLSVLGLMFLGKKRSVQRKGSQLG